jgi:hypothetical protein
MSKTIELRLMRKEATEKELYQALDNAGIEFEVVRIEEGLREIAVCVKEKVEVDDGSA